jgi:hypothetical protein
MGTIIISGRRYLGNNVKIRKVIDGKSHDGELHGGLDMHVFGGASGGAVRCGGLGGDIAADASVNVAIPAECSVTARGRAGGSVQAMASTNNNAPKGDHKKKKR